jgi:hypothetical protein
MSGNRRDIPSSSASVSRLKELHAHVCSGECDADEEDPNEAGECDAWDALRDAYNLGAKERP